MKQTFIYFSYTETESLFILKQTLLRLLQWYYQWRHVVFFLGGTEIKNIRVAGDRNAPTRIASARIASARVVSARVVPHQVAGAWVAGARVAYARVVSALLRFVLIFCLQ